MPIALAALAIIFAGCRTVGHLSPISTAGPGWQVFHGQALWRSGRHRPELGGDLVVARHASGGYVFDFEKTPLPITAGQATATNWLIEFPAGDLSFGGKSRPPARFAWLYLGAALDGRPLPKRLRFERKADGNWRLENTRTGESIEGFLSP